MRSVIGALGAGVVTALALGGCILPASLSAISTIFDGASYAATGKSLQDQAISALADQDCALWRAVKGRAVCVEKSGSSVASLPVQPPARSRDGEAEGGSAESGALSDALPDDGDAVAGMPVADASADAGAVAGAEPTAPSPAIMAVRMPFEH